VAEQVVGVEGGVEPIETDVTPRIDATDLFGHADAEPQRRVHRDRDPDEARSCRLLRIEALDAMSSASGIYPTPSRNPSGEARPSGWWPSS
jgi:hypothetical protein